MNYWIEAEFWLFCDLILQPKRRFKNGLKYFQFLTVDHKANNTIYIIFNAAKDLEIDEKNTDGRFDGPVSKNKA